ncbi:MAG: hypothetical protein JWQ04_3341 [Pedosphaera sp.]|nr:hypothetical protein [Pedosphaera sp.]
MMIWLFALVLFGCVAYVGFAMGAIRASASLLGLLVASLLAPALGHIFNPLVSAVGVKSPLLVWVLGPFIAFIVVLAVFKIIGHAVHRKVDVYYKYKAGDLRMGLFNRLNARVGIAVGVMNAAVYLILISWVVYVFSYATTQVESGDTAPWAVRMLNSAGESLQSSGMAKVSAAVDKMPQSYYQAADTLGLIYHNDLLEARLSRYPAFLALAERPEFQEIGNDKDFAELRQKQPPITEILDNPKAQNIVNNPGLLNEIWTTTTPHLTDLQAYLKTGQSAEYAGEKILGRWDFDQNGPLNAVKRAKPNIGVLEMQRTKQTLSQIFAKTTLVATPAPDKLAFMKDYGKLRPGATPKLPPTVETQSFKGTWTGDTGKYGISFPDAGKDLQAVVDGDRLTVTGDFYPLVFSRE